MGSWISRFGKKTSTVEVLECLEKDITSLERLKRSDVERQRRIVGSLIVYSVLIYISGALLLYFYFMPTLWFDRFLYCLPLIVFPLLVWLLKRFLHWFYVKRIQRNDEALERLKEKKKHILDEIMEKETYKKAKEILAKFAAAELAEQSPTPANSSDSQSREGLRHRAVGSQSPSTTTAGALSQNIQATPPRQESSPAHSQPVCRPPPPGPPLPRPILPRDRSLLDRLMEYLIGDGPQNRFALICAECQSHNGMALREEFEYIGFRCCYCYHVNEARKQRPRAPSLDEDDASATQQTYQPVERQSVSEDDELEPASTSTSTLDVSTQRHDDLTDQ